MGFSLPGCFQHFAYLELIIQAYQQACGDGSCGRQIFGQLVCSQGVDARLFGLTILVLKGKRGQKFVPAHQIEDSLRMAKLMEEHTGLALLVSEDGKVG